MKKMMTLQEKMNACVRVAHQPEYDWEFDTDWNGFKYKGGEDELFTPEDIQLFTDAYETAESIIEKLERGEVVTLRHDYRKDEFHMMKDEASGKYFIDPEDFQKYGVFDYDASHVRLDAVTDTAHLYHSDYEFNILVFNDAGNRDFVIRADKGTDVIEILTDMCGDERYEKKLVWVTDPCVDEFYIVKVKSDLVGYEDFERVDELTITGKKYSLVSQKEQ